MIALIDCNNFFVSCERIFDPSAVGRPTVVLSNNDGCAISRSNEAKDIGIKMGQPHFQFRDLEKIYNVKVFSANFSLYGGISKRVMTLLARFSSNVEVYSIDEAFLELDNNCSNYLELAKQIKDSVMNEIGVPVSVGIAKTKVLAKLACEKEKRSCGYCVLQDENEIDNYLKNVEVGEVWGIGRNYAKAMNRVNVKNVYNLKSLLGTEQYQKYNVNIKRIIEELNGKPCISIDNIVKSKKSIAHTRTLFKGMSGKVKIEKLVADFAAQCTNKLQRQASVCTNISVFLAVKKPGGGYFFSSEHISFTPTSIRAKILKYAIIAANKIYKKSTNYGRVGVMLYGISPQELNTNTLFDFHDSDKEIKIETTINRINSKYHEAIKLGNQSIGKSTYNANQHRLSKNYLGDFDELLKI